MFNVGDAVVYANTGICVIDDIRMEEFLGKKELYYILKPVFSRESTICCPVDNRRVTIRSAATKEELSNALASGQEPSDVWIENDHERRAYYQGILKNCDLAETASVVRTLNRKKREKTECGKKLHATDEKALEDAEKILYGEISYVFEISYDEAAEMFRTAI